MASSLGLKLSDFPYLEVGTNSNYPKKIDNAFFYTYSHTNYGIKYIKRNYQLSLSDLQDHIHGYIGVKNAAAEFRSELNLWSGDYYSDNKAKSYVYEWQPSEKNTLDYAPNKFKDIGNTVFFINAAPIPMEETAEDPHKDSFKVVSKDYIDERHNGNRFIECTDSIELRPYTCIYNFDTEPEEVAIDTSHVTNDNSLTFFVRVPSTFESSVFTYNSKSYETFIPSGKEKNSEHYIIEFVYHDGELNQIIPTGADIDLSSIYERLDDIENRLENVASADALEDLQDKLGEVSGRLDDVEGRVEDLEGNLENLQNEFNDFKEEVTERIDQVEKNCEANKKEVLDLIDEIHYQDIEKHLGSIFANNKTGAIYTTKFYNYGDDLHNDLLQSFERSGQKGIQYNNANCFFVSYYADHTGRLVSIEYVTGDNKVIAADGESNRKLLVWRKLSEDSDECEYLGCSDNTTNYEVLVYRKYTFNNVDIRINAGDNIYITSGNAGDNDINALQIGAIKVPTDFGTRQWRCRVFDIGYDKDRPNLGYYTTGTRRMHLGMPVMDITVRDYTSSVGFKQADNAELVAEVSTNLIARKDDYLNLPLFKWIHCNYKINESGDYVVTALEGDSNYMTDGDTNVGIIAPTFYWKYEQVTPSEDEELPGLPPIVSDGEDDEDEYERVLEKPYYTISISDSKHDDTWHPWLDCVNSDGEVMQYYIRPAYFKSLGEDGKLHSLPNKEPLKNISLQEYKELYNDSISRGVISQTLQQIMVAIKYGIKSSSLAGFVGVTENELDHLTGETDMLVRKSDGSYMSNEDGHHPYRIQGIEHGIGLPILATDMCVIYENRKANMYDIRNVDTLTVESVRENGTFIGELPLVTTKHCVSDVAYHESGAFLPTTVTNFVEGRNVGYLDSYYVDVDQTQSEGIYAIVLHHVMGSGIGSAAIGTCRITDTTYSGRPLILR